MSTKPDLPFFNGQPVELGGRGWLIVLGAVAIAFLQLISLPLSGFPLGLLPPILFSVIPLAALAYVAGPAWKSLFRRFGLREIGLTVLFAVLTTAASFTAGFVLQYFITMTSNPIMASDMDAVDLAILLVRSAIQLVGEEAVTILPLLAVMWFCFQRLHWSRTNSLIAGIVVSTLWFSAMHLPTYGWNFIQTLGAIGTARLVLTASYLITRNMYVSIGAHILNDWTLFFGAFAIGHMPVDAGGFSPR